MKSGTAVLNQSIWFFFKNPSIVKMIAIVKC